MSEITEADKLKFQEELLKANTKEIKIPRRRTPDGQEVIWAPQGRSQKRFLGCPVFEALYHGTRGPGKTDALIMAFAQHVGKGHGAAWRGILFRQTYPQLADVQAKTEKWFRQMFPAAKFNRSKMQWEWPTGEALLLRHMQRSEDYWNYHGHEYPFIGWEELTNWKDDACYKAMFACCRSSTPNIPKGIRATTNPYGIGHNWVKDRFNLHGQWWKSVYQANPKDRDGRNEPSRIAIHGHISENKILLAADPKYMDNVVASAANPAMAEAWLNGSWDIVAGGMFDDVWSAEHNVVPRFVVPDTWRIDRSFDWGSSAPFSVGWWAQSDGSDIRYEDGRVVSTVPGDLFRIKEWYGWNGNPNQGTRMLAVEIAAGIVERELLWHWRKGDDNRVSAGVADSSIFSVENGVSVAQDMMKPVRIGATIHKGIYWLPADKRPGSRVTGWEMLRKMMKAAKPKKGLPREDPGIFVVGPECDQFMRTVTALPRSEKNMDDVDTEAEDHIADEVRYRIRHVGRAVKSSTHVGMY